MYPDDSDYVLDAPDRGWNYEPSRAELFKQFKSAVYTTDADGWLTYYNDAAADLWGYRPELGKTRWCGSWRIFTPDGAPLPLDQCPMAVALKEGRAVRGVQAVLERPDGTLDPVHALSDASAGRIRRDRGRLQRASATHLRQRLPHRSTVLAKDGLRCCRTI